MNRLLTLIILIISLQLYSQNIVIKELCIDHKKGTPNREAAHSYFDKDQNKLFLTFMNKTTLYLNTYVDLQVKEHYEYVREEDPGLFNQVSDAVLKDQKDFYLFFANPTCADFSVIKINLLDKSIQRFPELIKLGREELYLYSFSTEGKFYILSLVKKTSLLILYSFDFSRNAFLRNEINVDELKISVNQEPTFENTLLAINTRFFTNPDLFKYSKTTNVESEIDPLVISKSLKFYPRNGHLVITVDGDSDATYLFDINLENNKIKFDQVPYDSMNSTDEGFQNNSYLFENVIFQIQVTKSQMTVSIKDQTTKQKIKSFTCNAEDSEIPFANSPIKKLTKEKFWGYQTDNEVAKVKKLLRICSKNNIFIGALKNQNGQIEMTIGSYFVETYNYYGGMGMGPGVGMGGSTTTENLYFFKSIVAPDYSNNITGQIGESFYDKLISKQKNLTSPPKSQVIFKLNDGVYYLGYFQQYAPPSKHDFDNNPIETYYYVEKFGPK